MGRRDCRWYGCLAAIFCLAFGSTAFPAGFSFKRDTLSFANSTVFQYEKGRVVRRTGREKEKSKLYTRRCFVMSRTVLQFHKFARFDPKAAPLGARELAHRVRAVTHKRPWAAPLPAEQRVVFPGYGNLRALSIAHPKVLQDNIGLGWPTYLRPGNARMFYKHDKEYQEKSHADLEATLARGEMFVAYLSDFPTLHINHSVLVYGHKAKGGKNGVDRYLTYDPNHPDGPRELTWLPEKRAFEFEKDEEFVGGFTRVFQVYGKAWQ